MIIRIKDAASGIKHFKTKLIIAVIIIISICAGSAIAASELTVTSVYCDNEVKKVVSGSSLTSDEILKRLGMEVGENQQVILDLFDPTLSESVIVVANPHNVLIYDGEEFVTGLTVTGTVGDAVKAAGITLNDGDELNFPESEGITEDIQIKISRAFNVTISADGEKKQLKVTGGTVAQALKEAGVIVKDGDIISHKLTDELTKKTTIKIQRVTYKTVKKSVDVDYDTKVEYDDSMFEDQTKVKVKGVKGEKVKHYSKKYVDGKLKSSKRIKTETVKEPVTEILIRGTKIRPGGFTGAAVRSDKVISELTAPFDIPLSKSGRPVNYKKVITGKATAYCTGTTTSTGARAMPGRVAVDPREIPYGTKMYIVSSDGRYNYGYCVASDTGGFIYNSNTVVDLYMHSYNACMTFGRRNVDIYILEWG